MSTSAPRAEPRAIDVKVSDDALMVTLMDGRRLSVPLNWFPRLSTASSKERSNFELLGGGVGIHWPDIDEDLSVEGLFRGIRAPEPRSTSRER